MTGTRKTLHRVYMVVSVEFDDATQDRDVKIACALGAAEDRLTAFGGQVLFSSVAEGYDGEFAAMGADPSSWDGSDDR